MNAALLVMSSALAVGGDVVPAGGIIPAGGFGADAAVVAPASPGPGCGSCGPVVNAGGCCKGSFFDKLKGRFAPKPKCCAPAPTCGCETHRPNLLDKLKSKKHSCGCETVAPCATVGAPIAPPPAVPPKDMPPAPPKTKAAAPAVPAAPIVSQDAPALPLVPLAPIPSSTKTSAASPY